MSTPHAAKPILDAEAVSTIVNDVFGCSISGYVVVARDSAHVPCALPKSMVLGRRVDNPASVMVVPTSRWLAYKLATTALAIEPERAAAQPYARFATLDETTPAAVSPEDALMIQAAFGQASAHLYEELGIALTRRPIGSVEAFRRRNLAEPEAAPPMAHGEPRRQPETVRPPVEKETSLKRKDEINRVIDDTAQHKFRTIWEQVKAMGQVLGWNGADDYYGETIA